ncbi:hypothetical protein TREES_T100011858 [Tupaia chinensis]|uniref:Uncharacterized protein n=1 Tax=Tupaia chinensis TaxID=246437 RepID=L9KWA3_TUPCH|nr:hypothetical protein TREES_T100011858 [Tupaia chinensis]
MQGQKLTSPNGEPQLVGEIRTRNGGSSVSSCQAILNQELSVQAKDEFWVTLGLEQAAASCILPSQPLRPGVCSAVT